MEAVEGKDESGGDDHLADLSLGKKNDTTIETIGQQQSMKFILVRRIYLY